MKNYIARKVPPLPPPHHHQDEKHVATLYLISQNSLLYLTVPIRANQFYQQYD